MKKHLVIAGIQRVQTDLDYSEQEFSTVTLKFIFQETKQEGITLDDAQRELIEVIEKAIVAHTAPKIANFEYFDRMKQGLCSFDWNSHFVKGEKANEISSKASSD